MSTASFSATFASAAIPYQLSKCLATFNGFVQPGHDMVTYDPADSTAISWSSYTIGYGSDPDSYCEIKLNQTIGQLTDITVVGFGGIGLSAYNSAVLMPACKDALNEGQHDPIVKHTYNIAFSVVKPWYNILDIDRFAGYTSSMETWDTGNTTVSLAPPAPNGQLTFDVYPDCFRRLVSQLATLATTNPNAPLRVEYTPVDAIYLVLLENDPSFDLDQRIVLKENDPNGQGAQNVQLVSWYSPVSFHNFFDKVLPVLDFIDTVPMEKASFTVNRDASKAYFLDMTVHLHDGSYIRYGINPIVP